MTSGAAVTPAMYISLLGFSISRSAIPFLLTAFSSKAYCSSTNVEFISFPLRIIELYGMSAFIILI